MTWEKFRDSALEWLAAGIFLVIFALLSVTYALASEGLDAAKAAKAHAIANEQRHNDTMRFLETQLSDIKALIREKNDD